MTTIKDPKAMTTKDPRWLTWYVQQRRFERIKHGGYTAPSLVLSFENEAYQMGAQNTPPDYRSYSDLITFTRASGGGIINAAGQFEWVGKNVPRITYDPVTLKRLGQLIEEQRTNLLLQSAAGNAAITFGLGTGITKGAGPVGSGIYGGSSRAGSVAKNSVTGRVQQNANVTAATPYTASIFIRKPPSFNGEYCAFGDFAESGGLAIFNPFSGTIASTQANVLAATVTDFGAFWRIAVTRSMVGATFAVAFFPFFNSTGTATEGSGIGSGYAHLVDGVQLELGSFATSTIPTATAQVTRAADVATVDTLSPWYNALEGSIVVSAINSASSTVSNTPIVILDGPATNIIRMREDPTSLNADIFVNGSNQVLLSVSRTIVAGAPFKAALSIKVGSVSLSRNGSSPASSSSLLAMPGVNVMQIGYQNYNANRFNGIISSITYYPRVIDVQQASA